MTLIAIAGPPGMRGALTWATHEVKLAAKSSEREVVAAFPFKNTGSGTIAISDVSPGCDCTITELAKRRYAPGEEGTLYVRLAVQVPSGPQEEMIAVSTDEAGMQPANLRVEAEIQPLIVWSPGALVWRTGVEPEEQAKEIVATGALGVAAIEIAAIYPQGAATGRVETIQAGSHYRVVVRPIKTTNTANFTLSCRARYADGTTQEFVVFGMTRK